MLLFCFLLIQELFGIICRLPVREWSFRRIFVSPVSQLRAREIER